MRPGSIDSFYPVISGNGAPARLLVAAARAGAWGQEQVDAAGRRYLARRDDFGRTVATWSRDDGLTLHRYQSSAQGEKQTQIYLGKRLTATALSDSFGLDDGLRRVWPVYSAICYTMYNINFEDGSIYVACSH